jgi:hypothetical protein
MQMLSSAKWELEIFSPILPAWYRRTFQFGKLGYDTLVADLCVLVQRLLRPTVKTPVCWVISDNPLLGNVGSFDRVLEDAGSPAFRRQSAQSAFVQRGYGYRDAHALSPSIERCTVPIPVFSD